MQHQVAAVIIAMAQHPRFRSELAGDRRPFLGQRRLLCRSQRDAAIRHDEMTDEVLELPRQLLDVECHPVRQVGVRRQLGAPSLQELDERDCLPIQRRVLGRRGGTEMRLQRDVAKILQRNDPERVVMIENGGHGQRYALEQLGHVRERQRRELD